MQGGIHLVKLGMWKKQDVCDRYNFCAFINVSLVSLFLLQELYTEFSRRTLQHWKQESNMLFATIFKPCVQVGGM